MSQPKPHFNKVSAGLLSELPSLASASFGDEYYATDFGGIVFKLAPDGAGGKAWVSPISGNPSGATITTYPGGAIVQRRATAVGTTFDSTAIKDYYVGVTSTAAPRAIVLPPAVNGRVAIVKDESGGAGTNNITVTPPAGTIDGAASWVISTNFDKKGFISDGVNWFTL